MTVGNYNTCDSYQILEYLLNTTTVNINTFNSLGKTALLTAAIQSTPEITKILIDKGADLNLSDSEGNTPLHYAAYYNLNENCVLLLEKGANVNAQNKRGFTVLHVVCGVHNELESLAMLMYYGADPCMSSWGETGLGYTPFELCLMHNKTEFSEFLQNFIFDGNTKIPIVLKALVGVMEHNCELFHFLLDNISEVLFDVDELSEFLSKIIYCNSKYLREFLDRFDYIVEAISCVNNQITGSLLRYMDNRNRSCLQVFQNLYIIFSEPHVSHFIENVNKHLPSNIIKPLLEIYKREKLPQKPFHELILHLLSYGVDLTDAVLDKIYYYFGDNDFFRILLHMDVKKLFIYPEKAPFPSIIYDVDLKNVEVYFQEPVIYDYAVIEEMICFFAGFKVKDFCLRLNCREITEKVFQLPDVPLLLELTRNVVRNYIIDYYKVRNSRQFYMILDLLPISKEYKSVISFKRKLYLLG